MHASQGVGRLLGGSVAEQLARKAGVSLLLVRS
jgi:nucleotide-binding universal stress UspA family protein